MEGKAMSKKTSKHFRPASISADKHNKREKPLGHTRPELQPEDKASWVWEAEDKQSVYKMRKQAEEEYFAVERSIQRKDGSTYTAHRSLPKNAEPVKEAVVVIKEDTTIEQVKTWAFSCQEKYGIKPVGVYLHLDEGHWAELDEDAGQTEDMYERHDGKEWKRMNDKGNFEYWKPNFHAHVVFDWFDHDHAHCISLGKKTMSEMEDDLAKMLNMERGTPSGKKGLDANTWKALKESERINKELSTAIKKYKSLQTMVSNLTNEKDLLEKDLIDGYGEKNRKNRTLQELDEKIEDKQAKLDATIIEMNSRIDELAEIQGELQDVKSKWFGEYRKIAELKENAKQLNDTINRLKQIAEQVPSLQERLTKAETRLASMSAEIEKARQEGKREGKEEAIDELYKAAHLRYNGNRPSPSEMGKRYGDYRQQATVDLPEQKKENEALKVELGEEKEKNEHQEAENAAVKEENDNRSKMMEYLWPGAWEAAQRITTPGKYFMSLDDRQAIRKAVGEHPNWSISQCHDLIEASSKIYGPFSSLIKDIYELVTGPARDEVGKYVNLSDDSMETQTTTACLFYGLLDAATQYSESAGGGGSPGSGWGRKKDEDIRAYAERCLLEARNMLQPSEEETPKETRRVGRRR